MTRRYEFRLSGRLSERARHAFCGMEVQTVPPQTIMFGDLAEDADLDAVLAKCREMGLQLVSMHRLPG